MSKGLVYYTDNQLDLTIAKAVRAQIQRACNGHQVIYVSRGMAQDFWPTVIVDGERGPLTMFRQILAGLETLTTDIAFLVEHDMLYHPSHFDFEPPRADLYYYNTNVWKVDSVTGRALHYDCQQTSGLCASRELLLQHYRERVRRVEIEGFSRRMGFEPGAHGRAERVDNYKAEGWQSAFPNIDIRHANNFTPSRWRKEQFRNQKYTAGWQEAEGVPGWGKTKGRFWEFLEETRAQENGESVH